MIKIPSKQPQNTQRENCCLPPLVARVLKDALFTSTTAAKLLGPPVLEAGLFLKGKFLLQNGVWGMWGVWGVCVSARFARAGFAAAGQPQSKGEFAGSGCWHTEGCRGWCFVF